MAFLQGSSSLAINGGQFNNVQGSQYIAHFHGNLLQSMHREEKESTIWDDYTRVRTGDVYVMKVVGDTEEGRDDDTNWRGEFLRVRYSGRDAFEAFKRDFEQFSMIKCTGLILFRIELNIITNAHCRHPNVTQLFGYNDNQRGLLALIFYDALIPLMNVFLQHMLSPTLFTYFQHQLGARQIAKGEINMGELWIDPKTGGLYKGPYPSVFLHTSFCPLGLRDKFDNRRSLVLSLPTILRGICWSNKAAFELLNVDKALSILSSLAGSIYNRHHWDIVETWAGVSELWHYKLARLFGVPRPMADSQTVLEDGLVRFTVTVMDIEDIHEMSLHYPLHPQEKFATFVQSWPTQAISVFTQFGICEEQWEEYWIGQFYWDYAVYNIIQRLQLLHGLSPPDLARSLGYPVLKILGDDVRFLDLEDPSATDSIISDILESYSDTGMNGEHCYATGIISSRILISLRQQHLKEMIPMGRGSCIPG
uniref:Protein kinase domain-containing protein n=1 Tax=Moniliophthora roreri TaxID=221103 RepID=A0A0W0FTG3_MONRR